MYVSSLPLETLPTCDPVYSQALRSPFTRKSSAVELNASGLIRCPNRFASALSMHHGLRGSQSRSSLLKVLQGTAGREVQ